MAFDPAGLTRDFGDIEGEARACREDCALFDFSFMARARITGEGAIKAIEALQPRPMADLARGRIRYALRLTPTGAVAADLTVWRLDETTFEVMSGRHEDIRALATLASADAVVMDLSGASAIFALQGPAALDALRDFGDVAALEMLPYFGCTTATLCDESCLIGRLGYTGERGFEIIMPMSARAKVWNALVRHARPAGFAAADILRIEAGFMLFVNECRIRPTASELGLSVFAANASLPPPRMKLVCFVAADSASPVLWRPPVGLAPPRQSGDIVVTSACRSVVAKRVIGLGFVLPDAGLGEDVRDPRGEFAGIRLERLPLYDPDKQRPRGPWTRHAKVPGGADF